MVRGDLKGQFDASRRNSGSARFLLCVLMSSPLTFPFQDCGGYRSGNVTQVHLLSL